MGNCVMVGNNLLQFISAKMTNCQHLLCYKFTVELVKCCSSWCSGGVVGASHGRMSQ